MSATKAGKRPLRSLTPQEKLNAIKRVSVGGESKASVARDIGVPESTLRGWCKNQEKISYQVRSSPSSNIEEGPENINILPPKRVKLEEPYNLSMKTSDVSSGSYSPNSEGYEGEYPKQHPERDMEAPTLNLLTAKPVEFTPVNSKVAQPHTALSDKDKEREKNRAELARLSAELGLNRPEVTDVKAVLDQWKSVCQSLIYMQQQQQKFSPPKMENGTNRSAAPSNNGLLTTVDKRDKMLQNLEPSPSFYDSVSYWLRHQSLLNMSSNPATQQPSLMSLNLPSTSTITSATNTTTSATNNAMLNDLAASQTINQQMRFWNWYQHSAYNAAQLQAQISPPQQILYQQLTKEAADKEANTENNAVKEEKPKINAKNRSVLDNLLLNNNTVSAPKKEDVGSMDVQEALEHGEIFLYWLEHCSDPCVTTMQLHMVQSLIKNLRKSFDRRSTSDCQNRNKSKRK